jgi:hypothetical protein
VWRDRGKWSELGEAGISGQGGATKEMMEYGDGDKWSEQF